MTGLELAAISIVAMIVLIYLGMHVAIVLALTSFVGVWGIRGDFDIALTLLWGAFAKTIDSSVFAVVPLFVFMGALAGIAGVGRDTYDLAHRIIGGVKGSLGMATVLANAIFASITGVSVASAAIFSQLAVPEMLRHGYQKRFAVGVVAGSSVLGMLIPPSVLMIVYAVISEQSIGDMFIGGIGPGLFLAAVYCLIIWIMAHRVPRLVFSDASAENKAESNEPRYTRSLPEQAIAVVGLVTIVMGGLYSGIFTTTEAAAGGAFGALLIALQRKALTWSAFYQVLRETGSVTAVVLFLIVGASMYSRMLGASGLPMEISNWVTHMNADLWLLLLVYVLIVVVLGTLIDAISIMLIVVPVFLIVLAPFDVNLVWFGIITIVAAEIGLLTPPFGLSAFVVHSSLKRPDISLKDVFMGSGLFALMMLHVLVLLILFPQITLFLVPNRF